MGSVIVDMSHRLEVERPGGAKGAWIVRPLTYREFVENAKRAEPEDSVSNLEHMLEVCTSTVVGYRIDGKEHSVTREMLESAGLADIVECFRAVMSLSRIDAETAGN